MPWLVLSASLLWVEGGEEGVGRRSTDGFLRSVYHWRGATASGVLAIGYSSVGVSVRSPVWVMVWRLGRRCVGSDGRATMGIGVRVMKYRASPSVANPIKPLPDETQRRGALVLRTIPIVLIPLLAAVLTGLVLRLTEPQPLPNAVPRSPPLIPIVVVMIFFISLVILVRLGRPTISALLLIGTWTLFTTLSALQAGVTTFWPALLLMPICAAGLLIDGVASVILAALATMLVVSIAWLELHGLLTPRPTPPFIDEVMPIVSVGYWTTLFWTVAALTSLLAGSLQRALVHSRAQAEALSHLSAQLEARVVEQTAELAQRASRAEALYEIGRALAGTRDLPQVLGLIAEQAARLLHFDSAMVLLIQPDDATFSVMSSYHQPAAQVLALIEGDPLPHQALEERRPTTRHLALTDEGMLSAALALPMFFGADAVGVLVLIEEGSSAARTADDLALAEGFADHAAVAIVNAQLLAQSREAATLEERTRLARDIHDTLAQGLTGVVVQLGAAQRALDAPPEMATGRSLAALKVSLDLAQRMARESLAEARRSVWNLRSPALERGDLGDALRRLVANPLQPETQMRFAQCGEPWSLPPSVEVALLRVCQEALVNVAKHAHATAVEVWLDYLPDAVQLRIYDNGVGFDEAALPDSTTPIGPWGGFGLLGMRERITALGGTLTLTSNAGAQVVATIPRR